MDLFYTDFDRRFLRDSERQGTIPRRAMDDAQIIREMAEIWVDSGGDAGGLDDAIVAGLRAEIRRLYK
jgi:hypothetical protein